jgi:hypothetical protein
MSDLPDKFDFADELAAGITTTSYIERNPDQKSRVHILDLLEHANRHTVSLPDYVADHFKKCFDNGELTIKEATDVIDKLADYNISKGYSWKYDTLYDHVYSSETEQLKAHVTLINIKEPPFYWATLSVNGKETELCRSEDYNYCYKKIGEHFYNTALSDLSKNGNVPHIVKDLVILADDYNAKLSNDPQKEKSEKLKIPDQYIFISKEEFKKYYKDDDITDYPITPIENGYLLENHAYTEYMLELRAATYKDNVEQKPQIMIDLIEHADRKNVSLPGYVADHFEKCFEKGELTFKDAVGVIDKLAEDLKKKGYYWDCKIWDKFVYSSETEQLKAYILGSDKTNMTAILSDNDKNGKDTVLCQSGDFTDCKRKIGEHFYNVALSDLSKKFVVPQMVKDLVTLANKYKVIEEFVDRSYQLKLTLPKEQMEVIKMSLLDGTMSTKDHINILEIVAAKISEKGLHWAPSSQHLDVLVDKNSEVQAYVLKDSESFHAACKTFDKVRDKEIFVQIGSSSSFELLRSNIDAFITGKVIKEVVQDAANNLEKVTPEKKPSKEYALSL